MNIFDPDVSKLNYFIFWPSPEDKDKLSWMFFLKLLIYIVIAAPLMFMLSSHLIVILKDNLDIPVAEDISIFFTVLEDIVVVGVIIRDMPKISTYMCELKDFKTFEKPRNFERKNRTLNKFLHFCFIAVMGGLAGCFLLNIMLGIKDANRLKGLHQGFGYLGPFYIPFDLKNDFLFVLFQAYTIIATLMCINPGLFLTFIMFYVSQHIIWKIDHLNWMFREAIKERKFELSLKKIKAAVEHHSHITNLVERFESTFSMLLLCQMTITVITLAYLEKRLLVDVSPLNIVECCGWLTHLIFASFAGQLLVNAAESIPANIWQTNWYLCDNRIQKELIFILMKSQEPLNIRVAGITVLSFELLVSILKMSYSVLCLLTS